MTKTFAIYTDLSGVKEMPGNDGGFPTRRVALERLVEVLEARRADAAKKLTSAKRALRKTKAE